MRRVGRILVAGSVLGLLSPGLPAAAEDRGPPPSPASFALERARLLFHADPVEGRRGDLTQPGPRDATPTLLRLAESVSGLPASDRPAALGLLARPTDGAADLGGNGYRRGARVRHLCVAPDPGKAGDLCIHWARRTSDAPPPGDLDGDGLPDQVETTRDVLLHVWNVEVGQYGYRPPRPDRGAKRGQGPTRGLDVYLLDVGRRGLFGYCTGDTRVAGTARPEHAYCVLDDDYAEAQYPGTSSLEALQVGAAHELFHAIQFAYERSTEDAWLKEGTATWMEDEVYDDVNNNYGYLDESALHQPEIPLDAFQAPDDQQDFEYGAWIFWRFLSEYVGGPEIIREVWEQTAPDAEGDPSAWEATRAALAIHPPANPLILDGPEDPLRRALAEFGLWNLAYDVTYEEGPAYFEQHLEAGPPMDDAILLSQASPASGQRELTLAPASRRYALIAPRSGGSPGLRLSVSLPAEDAGPEANLLVVFLDGSFQFAHLPTGPDGQGTIAFDDVDIAFLALHHTAATGSGAVFRYEATLLP